MSADEHLSPGQFGPQRYSDEWNNAPEDDTDMSYYDMDDGTNVWDPDRERSR